MHLKTVTHITLMSLLSAHVVILTKHCMETKFADLMVVLDSESVM